MVDLKQTREMAFKLASQRYDNFGKTTYDEYSPIYIASTSNTKDIFKLYINYQKVLAVGSTGTHGFEALLNNSTHVDLFDINELQRMFYELMKTAIMVLKYEDFIKYFTLKVQKVIFNREQIKDLLSNELYEKIKSYLPQDVDYVYGPLYDYYDSTDLILSKLYRFEHPITLRYLKKFISFYNEEEYYKLQKILRTNPSIITFKQASLTDVPDKFNEEYDLIILDNILQYYKDIQELDDLEKVDNFIKNYLSQLLSEKGVIQVNYGYQLAADALKIELGLLSLSDFDPIKRIILKEEILNGINNSLIKNKNGYTYAFLPGVEESGQNLVLSYKK